MEVFYRNYRRGLRGKNTVGYSGEALWTDSDEDFRQ
jgi:hypothetical protein